MNYVRRGLLLFFVPLLALTAGCAKESVANKNPITATLSNDATGAAQLRVVLTVDSAAYAMGEAVKEFLKNLARADGLAQVHSILFVVNERLVDNYGRKSVAPTASYEIATSDARKMNFDGITTFAVMNFARNMSILHPTARQDIEVFCRGEDGKFVQPFCETARQADFSPETVKPAG